MSSRGARDLKGLGVGPCTMCAPAAAKTAASSACDKCEAAGHMNNNDQKKAYRATATAWHSTGLHMQQVCDQDCMHMPETSRIASSDTYLSVPTPRTAMHALIMPDKMQPLTFPFNRLVRSEAAGHMLSSSTFTVARHTKHNATWPPTCNPSAALRHLVRSEAAGPIPVQQHLHCLPPAANLIVANWIPQL
jgi:hypothetical protein